MTFVRLCGIALLGSPRSDSSRHAHDPSWWMLAPMSALAVVCLAAAVLPEQVVTAFARTRNVIFGGEAGVEMAGVRGPEATLSTLGAISAAIVVAVVGLVAFLLIRVRKTAASGPTWGCGYAAPTPRMQYTGRSFSEMIAERIFPRFLRPRSRRIVPKKLFPTAKQYIAADCTDPINRKVYEPFLNRCARRFAQLRILQQGKVHIYILYILFTVVIALAWTSVRDWIRGVL